VRGRVTSVETGPDVQRVRLGTGETLTARLIVMASGVGGDLQDRLGLRRRVIQKEHSLAFGFNVARKGAAPLQADSITYYPSGYHTRIAYLTLFPIQATTRANMFAYWANSEPLTREFVRDPGRVLARLLPGLTKSIGEYSVSGRVESSRIDLYATEGAVRPGLVLLADAFQSVCPTTGTGLSKVFTDVDVLCAECVPDWLATPGMGTDKIARFYDHPRKRATDEGSLRGAIWAKRIATDPSPLWRLRRLRWEWGNRLGFLRTTSN
jgi:2-polyprenyl-6-methoxyphenol hydroxylase-like FAD-dependent oxidoreductase